MIRECGKVKTRPSSACRSTPPYLHRDKRALPVLHTPRRGCGVRLAQGDSQACLVSEGVAGSLAGEGQHRHAQSRYFAGKYGCLGGFGKMNRR